MVLSLFGALDTKNRSVKIKMLGRELAPPPNGTKIKYSLLEKV